MSWACPWKTPLKEGPVTNRSAANPVDSKMPSPGPAIPGTVRSSRNISADGLLPRRRALTLGLALGATPLLARVAAAAMPMIDNSNFDVAQVLGSYPEFSTFYSLLLQSGLASNARSIRAVTVFAPTNAAFAKYPTYYQTLVPGGSQTFPNTAKLIEYMRDHAVVGIYTPDQFANQMLNLTSMSGEQISITGASEGTTTITYHLPDGHTVTSPLAEEPIHAANGIIYPLSDPTLQ